MENAPQFQGQNNWNPPPFPQPPPPLPPQQKKSGAKTCLIVLLIVIAVMVVFSIPIVAVLIFGVASPVYKRHTALSNISTANTQIRLLEDALWYYKLEVGTYPSDLQGLVTNIDQSENWSGPYIEPAKIPKDPWGNEYHYVCPGKHNEDSFDLCSFGADGMEGGDGENADIKNWNDEAYW